MQEILVWAQMFFEDGSVSEGKRVLSGIYDDEQYMKNTAGSILKDLNRTEGYLVVWGAGDIKSRYYVFISSSSESETSA